MMILAGNPVRNLVRRWQDISQGPRIPLFAAGRGRRGMEGSGENPVDLLLDPAEESWDPENVPRGYLAVYVGPEMRRFVIPASFLAVPAMRALMERAAEEFGYGQRGGLRIPCEEAAFEEILAVLEMKKMQIKKDTKKKKKKKNKVI